MPKINKNISNPFHALAEALVHRGDDEEDIARELATAFRILTIDGLGIENKDVIQKEFMYLAFEEGNTDHRHPSLVQKKKE